MKIETAAIGSRRGMRRLVLVCLAASFLLLAGRGGVEAQGTCQPSLKERQRYGFVALAGNWSQAFDVDRLNAGWYLNPVVPTTPHPGMDQTVVIRTPSGYSLNPATLGPLVDANPGAIWLIGSEPDCIWQDNVKPEEYARIYHDLYVFIKNRDQMGQVAAGGIVQPTPLRLEYLDRVLAAYQARYARPLPVDLWHIHNAILNEELGGWGADIPPGITADQGVIRSIDDNDNIWIFQSQVRAFRQWMLDRGYGGYPLLITEYGVLMPDDYGFDVARVNRFMTNTFAYLAAASDPVLGAPWDGGRLVQRWAWFSLDEQPYDDTTGEGFNGNLFDPETQAITAHGEHFASLTAGLEPLLHVDLGLGRWQVPPLPEVVGPGQTVDQQVEVRLVNAGTADSGAFRVRLSYAGPVSGTSSQLVDNVPSHAARWIAFTLPDLSRGRYALTLEIDVDGQVEESAECNNEASRWLLVPGARSYLALAANGPASGVEAGGPATLPSAPPPQEAAPVAPDQPAARVGSLPVWVEHPLPQGGSYPGQLALDPATGWIWVTERDGDRLARFDPGSGWREYDLGAGSQPWGVAVDTTGNVWFAEAGANRIGKLEPGSGTITRYGGLAPGSQPWGLAVGGDGIVWFTERAAGQLGRLDPGSGQIVERGLPSQGARPGGIAVYGDNVWFAETGVNRLGRFDISKGLMYEFHTTPPFEDPLIGPEDVTVIAPGNPWLSNTGGNGITLFRFSTLQNFNTIEVPTPGSAPYGITTGGPRSIWFTERAGNKLGRYGPEDYVVEYLLPTPGSGPTDIVVDGEGCAWYTAPGTNRIGRLCFQVGDHFTYLPLVLK